MRTGETFRKVLTGSHSAAGVAEWLRSLPQPVYCAYEPGCTGFHLARGPRALGIDCDVISFPDPSAAAAFAALRRQVRYAQQEAERAGQGRP